MPSDWAPALVSIAPGSFANIWMVDPKTKKLEEMQPVEGTRSAAVALVRSCGGRFYLTKRRRIDQNDWVWVAHDAARKADDPLAMRAFETQDTDGPFMWALAMGALS